MILKLKKGTVPFMNKDLLYVDFKSVKLDRVLTNLFIKMYFDYFSQQALQELHRYRAVMFSPTF